MGDLAPHRLALPLISNELGLLLAEMGLITRLIVVAGGVRDSSIKQVHVGRVKTGGEKCLFSSTSKPGGVSPSLNAGGSKVSG